MKFGFRDPAWFRSMSGGRLLAATVCLGLLSSGQAQPAAVTAIYREVARNGMDPSANGDSNRNWNFDDTSITTFDGWQYAAYWNNGDIVAGERRYRVAVARRALEPLGDWEVTALDGYHRNQDPDPATPTAAKFGDGHEKVAIGVSPDGIIHLVFDLHADHLHYVCSRSAVARQPGSTGWAADLFEPVRRSLNPAGPTVTRVTYPRFYADYASGRFALYLRTGGSGSGDSHLFNYDSASQRWDVATENGSRILDNETTAYPDGTVNAYPIIDVSGQSLHMLWTWRGTPDAATCFDIAHAYSPNFGAEWRDGQGQVIGTRGAANGSAALISADDPGVQAVPLALNRIGNASFAAAVGPNKDIHVYYVDRQAGSRHYRRRSGSGRQDAGGTWGEALPAPAVSSPILVTAPSGGVFLVSKSGVHQIMPDGSFELVKARPPEAVYGPADLAVDYQRLLMDGVLSVLGQDAAQTVFTVDYANLPRPAGATLRITQDPLHQTVAPGGAVTFAVTVADAAPGTVPSYQWRHDGRVLAGATGAQLHLDSLSAAQTGDYTVEVTDGESSVVSSRARLIVAPPEPGRLRNLSVRSRAGSGAASLVAGFVVDGGTAEVLVRGIGPGLSAFGVSPVLPDPSLALFRAQTVVATNGDWAGGSAAATVRLRDASLQVGAFALDPASADAALLAEVVGPHTAHVSDVESGIALVEVYEVGSGAGRLTNLSARTFTGEGGDVLVAGFVVDGNVPRRLLLRAVGPELARYGVEGVIGDPVLRVFDANGRQVAFNDDWEVASVAAEADRAGAFPLAPGGRDAALVAVLLPGLHTAHVSNADGLAGIALVEVYLLL